MFNHFFNINYEHSIILMLVKAPLSLYMYLETVSNLCQTTVKQWTKSQRINACVCCLDACNHCLHSFIFNSLLLHLNRNYLSLSVLMH